MNIKYDLIPSIGIEEVSKVLTKKLKKYNKNEWKYGINWTDVLSSLKKHLTQFEIGRDFTKDGLLHMAEVATNALILCEYYSIYPQGDDRIIAPVNKPIIGLDLDDCIFDFIGDYEKKYNTKLNPYWKGNYEMPIHLKELENDKDFWINLSVLHRPTFEVDFYITSRSIPIEWIEESLYKNHLPCAPVYTVPWNSSKVQILKNLNISIFIDDKFQNFKEITDAGIFCYLMDAPHNQHYNVGHRRIFNLNKSLK